MAEWNGNDTSVTGNDRQAYEARASELYAKKMAGTLAKGDREDMARIEATTLSGAKNILKGD